MRIVLYNFSQPGDPTSRQGGGVAVYQGNLIRALSDRGDEVICLSSGDRYAFVGPKPRLMRKVIDGVERAIILNSPMFAPAHHAFHTVEAYNDSPGLDHIPSAFKARYGDVDVFHFQNVEGLTAGFFRALRATYPTARIVVSAHNYNLVCAQVNLWFREHESCVDDRQGRACVNCLMSPDQAPYEWNARRIALAQSALKLRAGTLPFRAVALGLRAAISLKRRITGGARPQSRSRTVDITNPSKASSYARNYEINRALAREVFDVVLAVSDRTRQVLLAKGLPPEKVKVSYIGTAQHHHLRHAQKRTALKDGLHIAYLGYMRADKGFYFFLESLFSLSEPVARKMDVTIAAPIWESYPIERLRGLSHRFRSITVHDGYNHANLDEILASVDLGVVPVLWEDNLPQVAIEMVTRGVPILTSNRGGAQEIAGDPRFVFQAGSTRAFCEKIYEIASGRLALAEFWKRPLRLYSMEAHLDDLLDHYGPPPPPPLAPVRAPTKSVGFEVLAAAGAPA